MSLPTAFLDELRARTTLSTLVGKSIKITKAGREYKGCCPFHNEKTPSFYVNDEKGFYHCFGCSAHGDAIRWMSDQRGLPFMDAVKELAAAAGMDVPAADPRAAERAERANSLYDVMQAAADWFVEQLGSIEGANARGYLENRGIENETARAFGLGYAPDSRGKLRLALSHFGEDKLIEAGLLISVEGKDPYDRFRGRLMIPIKDARGRVIAFGGRILGAGEPKYLNSPETPLFEKGRTLYNIDKASAQARRSGRLTAVEGYLDVIMMSQAGLEGVVAPLGTALTEQQLEMLWRYTNVPILCFDGDSAGQKAADRAAKRALPFLRPGFSVEFVTLPEGKDPADLVQAGATAALTKFLMQSRQDVSLRIWNSELLAEPILSPTARAGLRDRLQTLAASVANELVRQEFKSTFNSLFWETFGWKRKNVEGLAGLIVGLQTGPKLNLIDGLLKAVLMGLCRYPNILRKHVDEIDELHIANERLRRLRGILTDAIIDDPSLEEPAINAILQSENIDDAQKRNLRNDLAFSFYFKPSGDGRAERDLREVIATLNMERELEQTLARANESVKAATDEANFAWQQEVKRQHSEALSRLMNFVEAPDGIDNDNQLLAG